jgi:small subunit ribosomal protein S21
MLCVCTALPSQRDTAWWQHQDMLQNPAPDFGVFSLQPGAGAETAVQVIVRDNNVDQALKALKKKMQREGIFREMKLRRSYEKPSERRAREKAEAVRRARKIERKRLEREGF